MVRSGTSDWLLAPVILEEEAVGIAVRLASTGDSRFIEVFAPDGLATKLNLNPGSTLRIRLLSGMFL